MKKEKEPSKHARATLAFHTEIAKKRFGLPSLNGSSIPMSDAEEKRMLLEIDRFSDLYKKSLKGKSLKGTA